MVAPYINQIHLLTEGHKIFSEIDRFANWVRRRNPRAYTAKSYRYHLLKLTEILGDRRLARWRSTILMHSSSFKPCAAYPPLTHFSAFWEIKTRCLSVRCSAIVTICATSSDCPECYPKARSRNFSPLFRIFGPSHLPAHAKLLVAIYSYFAEVEQDFISLRTKQGATSARKVGGNRKGKWKLRYG